MPYPVLAGRTAMYDTERARCAGGTLELLSAADQVLAVFDLDETAGSVDASGQNVVWTLDFEASTVNGEAAAGVGSNATKAHIKNSGGVVEFTALTVSHTSGTGDVKLINISISAGQPSTISSATITWPDPAA